LIALTSCSIELIGVLVVGHAQHRDKEAFRRHGLVRIRQRVRLRARWSCRWWPVVALAPPALLSTIPAILELWLERTLANVV
jgi:hypothetical protein